MVHFDEIEEALKELKEQRENSSTIEVFLFSGELLTYNNVSGLAAFDDRIEFKYMENGKKRIARYYTEYIIGFTSTDPKEEATITNIKSV